MSSREPRFKVGDRVRTRFHGRVTWHTVKAVSTTNRSQTGVTYMLDPWWAPNVDAEAPIWEREHWIDEAWLEKGE